MKKVIYSAIMCALLVFVSASCDKEPEGQGQEVEEQAQQDALIGTTWKTAGGAITRYLKFFEGNKAQISFDDRTATFDGTYTIDGNALTFVLGWSMLGYSNGITIQYNYTFKTGEIDGDTMTIHGIIVSNSEINGQEFMDIYVKQ